ncbi:MAG: hypothetical protein WC451_02760 [Patescibacteria group bacterium]
MVGTFTATYVKSIPICADTVEIVYTYVCAGGSTGGAISSSAYLSYVDVALASHAVSANGLQIQENYNAGTSNGDITITCTANETGSIRILGRPRRV